MSDGDGVFGEPARPGEIGHVGNPVARLPGSDAFANSINDTRNVDPKHERIHPGWIPVWRYFVIDRIQAGGMNANPNFARARHGHRQLGDFKRIRFSRFREDKCFHLYLLFVPWIFELVAFFIIA
ncbi:hypothetical protein D3C74_333900 [compost metagenome]